MTDATKAVDTVDATDADESAQAEIAEQGGQTAALAIIDNMNKPGVGIYSGLKAETFEEKVKLVGALANSEKIDPKYIGTVINLTNFIAQAVQIKDSNPQSVTFGQPIDAARVILIDEDGTAYHATSIGLASALRTLVQLVGEPSTWPAPIPVAVNVEQTRAGFRVFVLNYV